MKKKIAIANNLVDQCPPLLLPLAQSPQDLPPQLLPGRDTETHMKKIEVVVSGTNLNILS
jgi:hypothetical protein